MKKVFQSISFEFYATIICFCLCFLFYTLVTDDYASFSANCAAGQFSDYPYCTYYWGFLGVSVFYQMLYRLFPVYDWMSMSFVFYEFCCLYLILSTLKNVVLKEVKPAFVVRIVQLLFALFFIDNIVYLSHTRSSLLFCGIALINLLFTDNINKRGILTYVCMFVFGMLMRPESGMGMLLLVSTGYFIYRFDVLQYVKRAILPIATVAIMLAFYSWDWSHTDLFLKKVEPEIEYKLMEKRVVGISAMKTATDSIKYQAAVAGTCFDTRVLTPDYFRSIIEPGADMSLKHMGDRFFHVISFYRYYLFVPFYGFALSLLCFRMSDGRKKFFKLLLFQIASFAIIYATDYTGGLICGRHFLNLQLISLLILSVYFFEGTIFYSFRASGILLNSTALLAVIAGAVTTMSTDKTISDSAAIESACYEKAMQGIEDLYSNRIIVFTTNDFHLFDHTFSIKSKKYQRNTYLMFDVWTYWLYPEYIDYVKRQCNCDPLDPVTFYNWLSSKNALYIAEPERYDLTSKYMQNVHGLKLNFEENKEYTKPDCLQGKPMSEFELRKVVVEP